MAREEAGAEGGSFDIQAVSRVAQILALYGPETTDLTAADVAERIGLNRTTAYRYCTSLAAAGLLERGERRGSFVLGALMMRLGIQSLGRRRVVEIAPPHLERLSGRTGVTAVLSLWGTGAPVVALVREDSTSSVLVTVRPGAQLEPSSAQMRVFLAYLPDPTAVEEVSAGLSPAERAALEADVYAARRDGYCVLSTPGGIFAAAAPVFDGTGICATVALLGAAPEAGATPPDIGLLVETAEAIGAELAEGRRDAELR
jgi:DNA-binding IclR family transcriptional regulator